MISLLEINRGDMEISSMIALNILVVRALLPIKSIPNMIFYRNSFNNKNDNDEDFSNKKLLLKNLRPIKNIHLNNISFMYEKTSMPLFNQFSINFSTSDNLVKSAFKIL